MSLSASARTGAAALAALAVLSGCSQATEVADAPSAPATSTLPTKADGANVTIQDYLAENNITESDARPGQPGVPVVKLPLPPEGWVDAGPRTPAYAVGALVATPQTAADPDRPPTVVVLLSKLTGNADPVQVLDYAPGELQNLPDYSPIGPPAAVTQDGFDGVQLSGNYTRDGVKRVIAQKTVVIPGQGGLYVLQITADGLEDDFTALQAATAAIDQFTTIVA